jgi:cell division protein FtsB
MMEEWSEFIERVLYDLEVKLLAEVRKLEDKLHQAQAENRELHREIVGLKTQISLMERQAMNRDDG